MPTIKLTSKRQVTLPKALCEDMDIRAGDSLFVERALLDGGEVWVLRPAKGNSASWIGALSDYAAGKKHDMASVRQSVGKARRRHKV